MRRLAVFQDWLALEHTSEKREGTVDSSLDLVRMYGEGQKGLYYVYYKLID